MIYLFVYHIGPLHAIQNSQTALNAVAVHALLSKVRHSGLPVLIAGWEIREEQQGNVRFVNLNKYTRLPSSLQKSIRNAQTVYSKIFDPGASCAEIEAELRDGYKYKSTMMFALHSKEKLLSLGLPCDDTAEGAKRLDALLKNSPDAAEKLSVLEHRRWLLHTLLWEGMVQAKEDKFGELFYTDGNTTHGTTPEGKAFHCCLVSSRENSHLTTGDWSAKTPRTDLDELDKISLKVRASLKKRIDAQQTAVEKGLDDLAYCSPQNDLLILQLRKCVDNMRRGDNGAAVLFDRYFAELEKSCAADGYDGKQLKRLEPDLKMLREWSQKKDYKDIDRQLTACLPYILACSPHTRLAVITGGTENKDHILKDACGAWLLDPAELYIMLAAKNAQDIRHLKKLEAYFRLKRDETDYRCHVFYSSKDQDAEMREELESLRSNKRIALTETEPENMNSQLLHCLEGLKPDHVDITNAPRELSRAIDRSFGEITLVTDKDGGIQSDAPELNYTTPQRAVTVEESLRMAGSSVKEINTARSCGLTVDDGKRLWELRQLFGRSVWQSLRGTSQTLKKDHFSVRKNAVAEQFDLYYPAESRYFVRAVLSALQEIHVVSFYRISGSATERLHSVSVTVKGGQPQDVKDILQAGIAERAALWQLFAEKNPRSPTAARARLVSLKKNIQKSGTCAAEQKTLLETLQKDGFLSEVQASDKEYIVEFRDSAVKYVFDAEGNVLELFAMISAMEAGFYSVENGISFPDAELDVVAANGLKTVFISCKDQSELPDKGTAAANEVHLNSFRYGLGSLPVLLTTADNEFTLTPDKHSLRPRAKEREKSGVYLVCQDLLPHLPQVLRSIADGKPDWWHIEA